MPYVYSTLGQDTCYPVWVSTHDLPKMEHQILIKGGTGVIDKNLVTPQGVRTEISTTDYEHLQKNEVFKQHQKNGFITIEEKKYKTDAIAKDLQHHDNSAQLTPQDFHNKTDPRFQEAGIKAAKPTEKKSK